MMAPEAGLSVSRQCALLGVARSGFYYRLGRNLPRNSSLWSGSAGFSPTIRSTAAAGCRWRSCERGFR
jgi:hypothetical protein